MKLEEFALKQKQARVEGHPRCMTCNLPPELRKQVEAGRASVPPISWTNISKWLGTEGHPIQHVTIRNHFMAGHASE